MTSSQLQLAQAWVAFFQDFPATHAVTLAYNSIYGGTVLPCYRLKSDGEAILLRKSDISINGGDYWLPVTRRVPLETVHRDIEHLHRNLDRQLFGSKFNKLPEHKRSAYVGFIEHVTTNIHIHLLWRVPDDRSTQFEERLPVNWRMIDRPHSQFYSAHVQPIRDGGWAHYVCKDQVGRTLEDDPLLFVSSRVKRP